LVIQSINSFSQRQYSPQFKEFFISKEFKVSSFCLRRLWLQFVSVVQKLAQLVHFVQNVQVVQRAVQSGQVWQQVQHAAQLVLAVWHMLQRAQVLQQVHYVVQLVQVVRAVQCTHGVHIGVHLVQKLQLVQFIIVFQIELTLVQRVQTVPVKAEAKPNMQRTRVSVRKKRFYLHRRLTCFSSL
jgi:hypothetical protein